jgi:mRNA interferase HigB
LAVERSHKHRKVRSLRTFDLLKGPASRSGHLSFEVNNFKLVICQLSFIFDGCFKLISLATWKDVVQKAQWKNKQDVLRDFPRAKMIKNNRARFEIVHNTYRLIAHIHYEEKFAEIRFIGTHAEYDRVDPTTV